MERQPLFSVITITWNAEKELPATLASLLEQKHSDFEFIVVDGASSDNTIEMVRRSGIKGMRIISEPDRGLYDAMNKGLSMAHGKYLIFLNAGDSFHSSDTLAKYADAATTDPDIIYGDTILVDDDRNVIGSRHLSVPEKLDFNSFSKGMLICHQSFAVRRSIAPEYNLNYRFSSDYEWCLRCIKATTPEKCVNLHSVVTDYLVDGLTTRNMFASLKERYRIMSIYYGVLPTFLRHLGFIPRFIIRMLQQRG